MKKPVQNAGAAYKKAVGALGSATLDRMKNAVTYRIYICEDARAERYEHVLDDYEKNAVYSSVWQSSLPPLYLAASEGGVFLSFGSVQRMSSAADGAQGHRRLHDVSLMLYKADGQVVKGRKAVQFGSKSRSVAETHTTSHDSTLASGEIDNSAARRH